MIGMCLQHGAGALGQLLPGHEVRVVLHRGDEDFVAGLHVRVAPTAGDQVDAGGRAGREDDLAGVLGADEVADLLAGLFVLLGAALAERVDAAVDVGVVALVDAAEDVDHLPRPLRAGGVVEKHQRLIAVDVLLRIGKSSRSEAGSSCERSIAMVDRCQFDAFVINHEGTKARRRLLQIDTDEHR